MLLSLFVLGLITGSFLNVVALRYREGGSLWKPALAGRSRCPHCQKTLVWYELIPVISFVVQRGKCRVCGHRLSWQYPLGELLAGFIMAGVPYALGISLISAMWICAFFVLLLVTLIDIRLFIIPDQLTITLAGLGFIINGVALQYIGGAAFGAALFGLLILITKGMGMGFGDVKLAAALGLLFGWPRVISVVMAAFLLGGVWASWLLLTRKKSRKDLVPFGPWLALGSAVIFWF